MAAIHFVSPRYMTLRSWLNGRKTKTSSIYIFLSIYLLHFLCSSGRNNVGIMMLLEMSMFIFIDLYGSLQGCTLAGFRHRPVGQVRPQSEPARTLLNRPNPLVMISWRIEAICILLCPLRFLAFLYCCTCMCTHTNGKQRKHCTVKPRAK